MKTETRLLSGGKTYNDNNARIYIEHRILLLRHGIVVSQKPRFPKKIKPELLGDSATPRHIVVGA